MTRILVDYGLGDLEEPDYQVLSDELCQTIRNRKETGAAAAASC
jgi:hypothetical protein